jgi:CBS domain-containing membrane protein
MIRFDPFRLLPRIAGARLIDGLVATVGALIGIGLTGLICSAAADTGGNWPLLVAPMGASAVLLFAVPASPLAQPWPVIGGNGLSALAGLTVAWLVPDATVAAAVAVAVAIGLMSLLRCLHPPGGAVALTAALGGPAVAAYGWLFPLLPVAVNSAVIVAIAIGFHRFTRHSYPHVAQPALATTHGTADPPPQERNNRLREDIDAVLEEMGEAFDIEREDLDRLIRLAERRAYARHHPVPACGDIMSKDVIAIAEEASPQEARNLLLDRGLRSLPVVDGDGLVAGMVGLRDLTHEAPRVADLMSKPVFATPEQLVLDLLDPLTDGRHHAAVIIDSGGKLLGLVTQTDLLVAISRLALSGAMAEPDTVETPSKV